MIFACFTCGLGYGIKCHENLIDFQDAKNNLEQITERQIGKTLTQIEQLHITRYRWASKRLRGNKILDCACGVGYGSKIIADEHPNLVITAVDISREAIEHAKKYYSSSRIRYFVQDMVKLKLEEGFD